MTSRSKLLVLEEGTSLSRSLAIEAGRRGFEIIPYRDATGVLVMARQLQADAMVLDAQLRGAGSVIAVKAFRRNANTAALPILAVTGRSGPQSQELLEAGVQACAPDGTPADKILDALGEHLQAPLDFTQAPAEALADPARVQAVEDTGMLDTPPDPAFDRLTTLASRLLVAPVALATFVTQTRQFLKSQVGLGEPWATKRETPLTHSFCQWVVTSNDALVVEDAMAHTALRHNRAIQDLGVAAYAGMPVTGRDDQPVGAMCAIDSRARSWTPEDLKTLQDLAVVASAYSHWSPARSRDAIQAAVRMIRRYAQRLRDAEGRELLDIVDEQSARLVPA